MGITESFISTMYTTAAWAKKNQNASFEKINIQRNNGSETDVTFKLKYCGICHSDVHIAENHMGFTSYPCVPGHELAGVVTWVGRKVTKVKVGDHVGVGCMVDSCGDCKFCQDGEEQFCPTMVSTYAGDPQHGNYLTESGHTHGGYSAKHTVPERFIVKIPAGYPLEAAGPVFCAGITMFTPLVNYGADKGGKRVGVVGIGGLGQMGVRLAKAMGNTVTAISTSAHKETVAREIGADNFVLSNKAESMAAATKSLDLILNTVSADHDLTALIGLLARDGTIVQLGVVRKPHPISQMIFFRRVNLSGSLIGGMRDTQDCINFCAAKGIQPDTELVTADKIEAVYDKLREKNDRITRYVLDVTKSA